MTTTNGSMKTTSVGMLIPATCSAVAIDRQMPNRNEPTRTQQGAAPREHGDHDGDEPKRRWS